MSSFWESALIIGAIISASAYLIARYVRRRKRPCPGCTTNAENKEQPGSSACRSSRFDV